MRELVADVAQLIDQRPLGAAENRLERLAPKAIHRVEQRCLVPSNLPVTIGAQARQLFHNLDLPMPFQGTFKSFFYEWNERSGK